MTACKSAYFGGAEVLPPLDEEEETRLLSVFFTKGDEQAKSSLIEHNLRLVIYIARRFANTGVSTEELISVGTIGLIKGINSFNPEKKAKLVTYAARCIKNEILMYLRRRRRAAREISIEEVQSMEGEDTQEDTSFYRLEAEAEVQMLRNAISTLTAQEQQIIKLRYGINSGEGQEMTQQEVSDLMGLSQSYISRLEKRIIRQLRKELDLLDA